MDLKKYLFVDAENIQLINYTFIDQDQYNNDEYSRPRVTPLGGESGVEAFERNGIPKEYQKVFMTYNPISMGLVDLKSNTKNLRSSKYCRFKAKGYLTETPLHLAISGNDVIFGQMAGVNPRFDVINCCDCKKEDVYHFFTALRENGYFDDYLKSISEILQFKIKYSFDSNMSKTKSK